jgi:tetratricopeptide (TPR) repeat protein
MHPFIKISFPLLVIALFISLISCQQNGDSKRLVTAKSSLEVLDKIPQLLDRNEKIRNGKEWETVQNAYGKARQDLMENPEAKEPLLTLAELFALEARVTGEHPHYYPAALKMLDELLTKNFDPADVKEQDLKFRALTAKAGVQLSLHDFAAALETGKQAIAMNPYNAAIYGVMTDANVELGNYEEAVKMADRMVSIRPDLRSYARVSYLREIHGDVDGAIEALQMACDAGYSGDEQTAWTRLTLGNLYQQYGRMKQAEDQYLITLAQRPDYPFALAALGDVELERKNYAKAEEYLNKAAAIIPEVGFYESLAKLYRETGRKAEFEKTLADVIAMMQDDEAHGHNMSLEFAHVYADLANDPAKALEFALKEYQKRPENIDVNGTLANLYSRLGKDNEAKMHMKKALRTGSKKPEW